MLLLPAPILDWRDADTMAVFAHLVVYDCVATAGEAGLSRRQRREHPPLTAATAPAWLARLAADLRAVGQRTALSPDDVWTVQGVLDVVERAAVNPFAVSRFEIITVRRMAGLSIPRRLRLTGGQLYDQDLHDRGIRALAWLAAQWVGRPWASGQYKAMASWMNAYLDGRALPYEVATADGA